MKRLIIAAMVAGVTCFLQAKELEEEVENQNWRITVGGFARGSMKAKMGSLSDRVELYGADMDLYYRIMEIDSFNLWVGMGGSFAPYQDAGKNSFYIKDSNDPYTTIELGGKSDLAVGYGEFRMMLVPEYNITDNWTVGARLGVAFDWLRGRGKISSWSNTTISIPGIPSTTIPVKPSSESENYSDFNAQAILGLQTTYFFTDNLGLYASIDYRIGSEAEFSKGGEKVASLDMDGWYTGVGIAIQF